MHFSQNSHYFMNAPRIFVVVQTKGASGPTFFGPACNNENQARPAQAHIKSIIKFIITIYNSNLFYNYGLIFISKLIENVYLDIIEFIVNEQIQYYNNLLKLKFIKIQNSNVQSRGVAWVIKLKAPTQSTFAYQISKDHYYPFYRPLDPILQKILIILY